jgi:hydroxymethylpyrimidine pyrophosphatase-like HAD family hydrolase
MKTLVFLDLDDTLFQTARKCPPGEEVFATSFGKEGQPVSYMTAAQRHFFDWLFSSRATLIPTTGRSIDAYKRVHLPFSSGAIVHHGATVLEPDGTPDLVWHAKMLPQLEGVHATLQGLLESAQEFSRINTLGAEIYWIEEDGLPLYLVAKHRGLDMEALERVRQFWLSKIEALEGLYLFANGNNVAVLPRCISKRAAVQYVLEREKAAGPVLSIGLGDSVSDLEFMGLCDFLMTPRAGQVFSALPRDLTAFR